MVAVSTAALVRHAVVARFRRRRSSVVGAFIACGVGERLRLPRHSNPGTSDAQHHGDSGDDFPIVPPNQTVGSKGALKGQDGVRKVSPAHMASRLIRRKDGAHVAQPFGGHVGSLRPAEFNHRTHGRRIQTGSTMGS